MSNKKIQKTEASYPPPPYIARQLGIPGNSKCVCTNGMYSMFCPFGHMTECHYPMTCSDAECQHFQRDHANESF